MSSHRSLYLTLPLFLVAYLLAAYLDLIRFNVYILIYLVLYIILFCQENLKPAPFLQKFTFNLHLEVLQLISGCALIFFIIKTSNKPSYHLSLYYVVPLIQYSFHAKNNNFWPLLIIPLYIIGTIFSIKPKNKLFISLLELSVFFGFSLFIYYGQKRLKETHHESIGNQTKLSSTYKQLQHYTQKLEVVTQELSKTSNKLLSLNELTQILGANIPLESLLTRILSFLHNTFYSQKTWLLFNAENIGFQLYSLENEKIVWKWLEFPDRKNWFFLSLFEAAHSFFLSKTQIKQVKGHLFWTTENIHSLYAVPLFGNHGVFGAVLLGNIKDSSSDHLIILQSMACQISVSIERIRMYTELEDNYLATIKALATSIEAKDKYTKGHSERVTHLSLIIGELMGLSNQELRILKYGGLLHDIGKIGIPEHILNKPQILTTDEFAAIKKHPLIGEKIISSIDFLKTSIPYIRSHHESIDGLGYPDKIKASKLPLGVRILSACDAFDAMSSDRPYRKALSLEECKAELRSHANTQFDAEVINTLIQFLNKYPDFYPKKQELK